MEPLRGNAEQISANTAAVISMNTIVITYEDLEMPLADRRRNQGEPTILQQDHLQEAPRTDQTFWGNLSDAPMNDEIRTNLTPPIKFNAQKLAAKLSMRFQLR